MSHTQETHKFVPKSKNHFSFLARLYERGWHKADIYRCEVCGKIVKNWIVGTLALWEQNLCDMFNKTFKEQAIDYKFLFKTK